MFKSSNIQPFLQGVLRSYSQIFFSENFWFALPLVIVSTLDISAGLCGLLSGVTANFAASILKYDKYMLAKGLYGYNSLLVGLGLGYYYELTVVILAIAVFSGFFTLFVTIAFQGVLGKYYLPNLSIPFVLTVWIVLSAGGMGSGVEPNHSGVYILNKLFSIGGYPFIEFHQWWIKNITSDFLNSYLQSLGAIFFQFNVFAGIVVAVALLFYSRIAFLLSLLGYAVALYSYTFLGMDMDQLGLYIHRIQLYLGAIAIGGFFYIPSRTSFLWAIGITPVIALVAAGVFGLHSTV
jgi:urea transporter